MPRHTRSRIVTTLAAAAALLLVAPALAIAAPAPISPRYASSAEAPAASWAGLEQTTPGERQVPVTDASITFDLQANEPSAATGQVLPAGLQGTIGLTVDRLSSGTTTPGALLTFWPEAPTGQPTGWPGANDTFLSSFTAQQSYRAWAHEYAFDFSGLGGGVLPAGSRLTASDIDVCASAQDERFIVTSSSGGAFLDYQYDGDLGGSDTLPTVTFDPVAGSYAIEPQCDDDQIFNTFITTEALSSLSIEMGNRAGSGLTRFSLLVPTEEPAPALEVVALTDSEDVEAAPGPELTIGDEVTRTIEVENTGNTHLTEVEVVDDVETEFDCGDGTATIGTLAPGETASCTTTETVEEGPFASTTTVTGEPVDSVGDPLPAEPATASDSTWFQGVEPAQTETPTPTPDPTDTTDPTETPIPTDTTDPTETPGPTDSAEPTQTAPPTASDPEPDAGVGPGAGGDPGSPSDGTLPETGGTDPGALWIVGAVLLALGAGLAARSRRATS